MRFPTLLFCIALFVGTGCDSNDPADVPITGSFSMTVSGDVNKTVNGSIATFGIGLGPASSESAFGINLGAATDVFSMARISGRVDEGTYDIQDVANTNDDDWILDDFGATYLEDAAGLFASVSGSVTITRSDDNVVEGAFTVSLVNFDTNNPSNITITGEFVAIGLELPTGG